MINELPDPVLTQVYRLKAVMDQPLDFGDVLAGHRRVVPLVGGVFTGPELNGDLLPGGSVSWQIVLPDGTALVEIRYTLRTDRGALLYVRSSGVGQGNREVAARLGLPMKHGRARPPRPVQIPAIRIPAPSSNSQKLETLRRPRRLADSLFDRRCDHHDSPLASRIPSIGLASGSDL